MKLKKKLIPMFISFALIPLIMSGIIINYAIQNSNTKEAYVRLNEELLLAKNTMHGNMEILKTIAMDSQNDQLLLSYLNDPNSSELNAKVMDRYKKLSDEYVVFDNIIVQDKDAAKTLVSLADNSGVATQSTTEGQANNNGGGAAKKCLQTKQIEYSGIKQSQITGNSVYNMAVPILNTEKQVLGVIIYSINLEKLSEKYINNIKIGSSGYIFAINNDGTTVIHPNKEEIFKQSLLATSIGTEILTNKTGTGEYEYEGTKKLIAYDEDKDWGLIYAANIPTSEFTGLARTTTNLMLTIGIIALIISGITSLFVSQSLTQHINNIVKAVENMAKGDFTIKVNVKSKDEIGIMANKINDTMDQLKHLISGVKDNSSTVGTFSTALANNSKEMTTAANEVAAAIEQIANGSVSQTRELLDATNQLNMLNTKLEDIYNKISNVNVSSKDAEDRATSGKSYIESLTISIDEVKQAFLLVNTKINGLGATVSRIGNITDSIGQISEQTNLLALNAAIEAARAGEQGKGFAVVADEVRKLAEESSKASNEIMNLITLVSNDTKEVMDTSKQTDVLISEQTNVVDKTIESFENILVAVQKITPMVDEAYDSVQNALKAKDIVVNKIEGIAAVAEEASASTEEISASTEEMLSSTEEVANISSQLDKSVHDLICKVDGFKVQ